MHDYSARRPPAQIVPQGVLRRQGADKQQRARLDSGAARVIGLCCGFRVTPVR